MNFAEEARKLWLEDLGFLEGESDDAIALLVIALRQAFHAGRVDALTEAATKITEAAIKRGGDDGRRTDQGR